MAIEPAGVSLEAQGFDQYIRRLNEIERRNRAVFDQQHRGTGRSFEEVTRRAREYQEALRRAERETERLAEAQRRASREARRLADEQQSAGRARQAAALSTVAGIATAVASVGAFAIEVGKVAAEFKGSQIGLKNLAASFGQSGSAIQAAIQTTSKGTISGIDAIAAANQALLLGVAQTPAEFEKLTNVALTLGRTLGLTGTESLEQFSTALGRQSREILDNFGISASQVNAEIEKLAQQNFGKMSSELSAAEKSATFMEAALNVAGDAAATIGEEAGAAQASFERLEATTQNLQVTIGEAFRPAGASIAETLSGAAVTAQKALAFISAGAIGSASIITQSFDRVKTTFLNIGRVIRGEPTVAIKDFGLILDEAAILAEQKFKDVASTIEGISFEEPIESLAEFNEGIKEAEVSLKGYEQALKSAERLQLSFARSAEDAALKLARANEDIARKQSRQVLKLEEKQAKDREKILDDQIKEREQFEENSRKEIAKAQSDIAKERAKADETRIKAQKKLQDKLRQQEEKFRLSQLQGSRRFDLAERRLRAEGDILALQELREDRELQLKEEKENFDAQQKGTEKSGKEQIKEQASNSENRISEIKERIEQERAELLTGFDQELSDFQQKQVEEKANLQAKFAEQAADRAIALAREEEDRRISQARQLEDLGRSLAEQEGVTKEGSEKIALALEEVFGIDGSASNIMSGFTAKTESEFRDLFENLNKIVTDEGEIIDLSNVGLPPTSPTRGPNNSGIPRFQEPGVVPGPIGSPQLIVAEGGEKFLGAQSARQSFQMAAPVIPAQSVNVNMAGGFNITGGDGNEEVIQAAVSEMTENFRIAVNRIARRN